MADEQNVGSVEESKSNSLKDRLAKMKENSEKANLEGAADTKTVDTTANAEAETGTETGTAAVVGTEQTGEFKEDKVETKKDEEKKATKKGEPKNKVSFSSMLGSLMEAPSVSRSIARKGSPVQKLQEIMSDHAEICGFIKPTNSRMELVVTKSRTGEYEINLKEKMSRTVRGVIFRYPVDLAVAINAQRSNVEEFVGRTDKEFRDDFTIDPTRIQTNTSIYSLTEFINWMTKYCWYRIKEAPAIYHEHMKYKKIQGEDKYEAIAVTSPDKNGAEYFIETKIMVAKERKQKNAFANRVPSLTDLYALKSSYRGVMLTVEGNYIAIERYRTIRINRTYSKEEADLMNTIYVEPAFGTTEEVYTKKIGAMSAKAKERVPSTKKGAFASQFFTEKGSLLAQKEYISTIPHYWDKRLYLNPNEVQLVMKDWNEKGTRLEFKKIAFGDTGNTLDINDYARIVKACEGTLTTTMVKEFIDTIKRSKRVSKERTTSRYDYNVQPIAEDLLSVFMRQ